MKARTNAEWLRELRSSGPEQQSAIDDLRQYLLNATLYFFSQRRSELRHLAPSEIEQMAQDVAQDALITILNHLDDFRGESKFTTWAYSFAINMGLVEIRRRRTRGVSLDELLTNPEAPELQLEDEKSPDPDRAARQQEILDTLQQVIDTELTPRQRDVLMALTTQDVPMEDITEKYHTNRNAVYKLVHDARIKLRRRLEERGFGVDEILDTFHLK